MKGKKRELMNELMVLFYPTNIYFPLAAPRIVLKLGRGLAHHHILYNLAIIGISRTKNLPCRPHKIGYLPRCDMTILLNTFPKTANKTWLAFWQNKKNRKIEPWNSTYPFADHLYKTVLSHFTLRDKPKLLLSPERYTNCQWKRIL